MRPERVPIEILSLLLLLAWVSLPSEAQISSEVLGLSRAQFDCLNALSFDLCIRDSTFSCPSRFFLDPFARGQQLQSFTYLVDRYVFETNASAPWLLSQTLSAGDSESELLDSTYGTNCSTDPSVLALLVNSTEQQASCGRRWWLILMQQANFCTENQIFVQGEGCICKEDKNCDETKTRPYTDVMRTMIFVVLVVLTIELFSMYVFTRQAQGIGKEYLAILGTISKAVHILQNAISENWLLHMGARLNGASAADSKQPPIQTSHSASTQSTAAAAAAASTTSRRKPPAGSASAPIRTPSVQPSLAALFPPSPLLKPSSPIPDPPPLPPSSSSAPAEGGSALFGDK